MTKELRDTIIQLFTEKIQHHEKAIKAYEAAYGYAAYSKHIDRQIVAEKERLESLFNDFTSQNRIIKTLLNPVDAGSYAKTADDLRKSGFCPWNTCMKQQSKPQQDAATDEDALRDIVKRYGIPPKIYVDLGDYPSRVSRNEETAADEKSHTTETGEKTVLDRTFGEVKESFMRLYDRLFAREIAAELDQCTEDLVKCPDELLKIAREAVREVLREAADDTRREQQSKPQRISRRGLIYKGDWVITPQIMEHFGSRATIYDGKVYVNDELICKI